MQFIPLTVVDNFFENPEAIREYALGCEYKSDSEGRWPGMRTEQLHLVDEELFHRICRRYFSLFFDVNNPNLRWTVEAYFQKIKKTEDVGWIHSDIGSLTSTIVYLTPDQDIGAGTSLYVPKEEGKDVMHTDKKVAHYKGEMSDEECLPYCLENNSNFVETARIGNKYNRLVSFDGSLYHGANLDRISDERLTLVFFTTMVSGEHFPLIKKNAQP